MVVVVEGFISGDGSVMVAFFSSSLLLTTGSSTVLSVAVSDAVIGCIMIGLLLLILDLQRVVVEVVLGRWI